MLMLSLHIAFVAVWTASLVYFPHLFQQQSQTHSEDRHERMMLLQRWMYANIMTPSALITIVAGTWLAVDRGFTGGWLPAKLALVLLMALFHAYCGKLMVDLKRHRVLHGAAYYRVLTAVPASVALAVIALVVSKPF